jgi:hypothetical protein
MSITNPDVTMDIASQEMKRARLEGIHGLIATDQRGQEGKWFKQLVTNTFPGTAAFFERYKAELSNPRQYSGEGSYTSSVHPQNSPGTEVSLYVNPDEAAGEDENISTVTLRRTVTDQSNEHDNKEVLTWKVKMDQAGGIEQSKIWISDSDGFPLVAFATDGEGNFSGTVPEGMENRKLMPAELMKTVLAPELTDKPIHSQALLKQITQVILH